MQHHYCIKVLFLLIAVAFSFKVSAQTAYEDFNEQNSLEITFKFTDYSLEQIEQEKKDIEDTAKASNEIIQGIAEQTIDVYNEIINE